VNWSDPDYLTHGSARQQAAYHALHSLDLFGRLRAYWPVLCGTIPLEIDTEASDLDVICEARDLAAFERDLRAAGEVRAGFTLRREVVGETPSVRANFEHAGFALEVFGQPRPVAEQNAYRHLVVEARLLLIGGAAAREQIRAMKKAGLKTEPAFAQYFGLQGDPYAALLALYGLTEAETRRSITHHQLS
jgi:hypothetical protein